MNRFRLIKALLYSMLVSFALSFSSFAGDPEWSSASGNVWNTTLTGNVGIGTSSPTKKLDLCGDAKMNNLDLFNYNANGGESLGFNRNVATGNIYNHYCPNV